LLNCNLAIETQESSNEQHLSCRDWRQQLRRLLEQVPVDVRLPAVGREVVEEAGPDDGSVSSSSDDEHMDMAAAQVRVS